MQRLGKLDTIDIILLLFIIFQVYWDYRQHIITEREINKERTL